MSRYSVILADPPWQYRAWKGDRGMRTAESFYPTMSPEELHALCPRIDQWAARDCALFLWATPPADKEAHRLLDAWGFTYKTFAFTWIKTTKNGGLFFGMGHYTRANAEMCLLATRGKPKVQARDVRQVIMAPRREHSRKPDEQYARIERLYSGPYLELFARQRARGVGCVGR
ncbi:MAG: MT-A70 family methyltransferase [Beijerinckiaceae bacterium]